MGGVDGEGMVAGPGDVPALGVRAAVRVLVEQRRSTLLTALFLVVGAAVLVGSVAARFPDISVYDEPAHLDYVLRAQEGEVPRMGDHIRSEVVDVVLCRGISDVLPQDCGSGDLQSPRLGADGYQYEAQQPPLYYLITGLLRGVVAVGPSEDLVLTTRLTGVAWLSAGLGVLWLALVRLRVRPRAAAAILAIAMLSPATVYHSSTVTNDAAVLLLGAIAIHFLLAARRAATWRGIALWSVVGAAAVWTKPQILLAVAVMAAVALLRRDRLGWRPVRDDLWLLPVVAAGAAYVVWGTLVDARATVGPEVVLDALLSFKQTDVFPWRATLGQLVGLVGSYVAPSPLVPSFVAGFGTLIVYLIIGSDLRAVLNGVRASTVALAGWLSLVGTVLAGPAFTVLFFIQFDVGDGPSPRYGLVLLPGMLLGLVEPTRHQWTRRLLEVLVLALAASLAVLIAHPTLRTR